MIFRKFIKRKESEKVVDSDDVVGIPKASVARQRARKRSSSMDVMLVRQKVRNAIVDAVENGKCNVFVSGDWLVLDADRVGKKSNSAYLIVRDELSVKGYSLMDSTRVTEEIYPDTGVLISGLRISWDKDKDCL